MKIILVLCLLAAAGAPAQTIPDINRLVLARIATMPVGGAYAASHDASLRLQGAARLAGDGRLLLQPEAAAPTYCSGATYLVFLGVIQALRDRGVLELDEETLGRLPVRGQADGQGVWGRWNANGPGTARLFHELRLGSNFSSIRDALPGDFMKIFWTPEVGAAEHGHSVVFLGLETRDGAPAVRFWSSNKPGGYGEKSVPLSRVSRAIFSRLETPANLSRARDLPAVDSYLSSLQRKRSSFREAALQCGFLPSEP